MSEESETYYILYYLHGISQFVKLFSADTHLQMQINLITTGHCLYRFSVEKSHFKHKNQRVITIRQKLKKTITVDPFEH